MFEWARAIHDAFNVESTWAFALIVGGLFAFVAGIGAGAVGYVVDKAYRKAEERRLVESTPEYQQRYVVRQGSSDFRLDTLDQDLRVVGIQFVSMSSPQTKPTPENDNVRQEYFPLKNGLYLRAQWRDGRAMPEAERLRAATVISAHETRLKAQ
jgi:hypothetical protein